VIVFVLALTLEMHEHVDKELQNAELISYQQ
jgi:hypothetical protein